MAPDRAERPILLFLPSLAGGGAERVMVTLANGFAHRGHAVDLVLARAEGPYLAEVGKAVRVVDLGAARVLAALPGLVRHLKTTRPRVLFATQSHANLVAIWARRLAAVHARLIVREANTASQSAGHAPTLRGRLMPLLMRRFYPWADMVVAPSVGVRDDLLRNFRIPRPRVRVLANPVVSAGMLAQAEAPLAHPWFASGESPVVVAVGRLTRQKDFATLIRAVAMASRQHPMRLLILGEGEERAALEELARSLGIAEQVALPGFVDNPFQYLRRAALFVLSSAWEGLPNALIQAMACGVPVVATDCPSGPAEILASGRFGPLVPVGDPETLARAILVTLARGNDQSLRLARVARAMDFSVDKIVNHYLNLMLNHRVTIEEPNP